MLTTSAGSTLSPSCITFQIDHDSKDSLTFGNSFIYIDEEREGGNKLVYSFCLCWQWRDRYTHVTLHP